MSSDKKIVLTTQEWVPSKTKFMHPKINDRGGKSINIISAQTNRSLHLNTPLMMTWGISDYVDEKTGEADSKFNMSLNFPNADYSNPETNAFLDKLKEFENFVIDEAVKYSEVWWGQDMSRDIVKHMFFPFLKYSKDKITKKTDYTKPPSIRAKVPYYDNKWGAVEIYDTNNNRLFPSDKEHLTPVDFVPKMSNVACIIQCGGIWIGGKGWGITWKLIQCVVKPKEIVSVFGKCHVQLSNEERKTIETQQIKEVDEDIDIDEENFVPPVPASVPALAPIVDTPVIVNTPAPVVEQSSTFVADSDDEKPPASTTTSAPVKKVVKKVAPAPEVVETPVAEETPAKKVVKKVVKK